MQKVPAAKRNSATLAVICDLARAYTLWGLTGVYLMCVHIMSVHLTGVHIIECVS
jgi:hypothetical protein